MPGLSCSRNPGFPAQRQTWVPCIREAESQPLGPSGKLSVAHFYLDRLSLGILWCLQIQDLPNTWVISFSQSRSLAYLSFLFQWSRFIWFSLVTCVFGIISKNPRSQTLPLFSWRSLKILPPKCVSLTHVELIFVCGVKRGHNSFFCGWINSSSCMKKD